MKLETKDITIELDESALNEESVAIIGKLMDLVSAFNERQVNSEIQATMALANQQENQGSE
jgi:hypothetical protein